MLTVATHSGSFHADDIFAFAILKAATQGDLTLIRSRDGAVLNGADVLFDVGGVYDPATRRYDHHMRDKPLRPDGTPYSSAGLIWRDFGAEAIRRLLPEAGAVAATVHRMLDQGLLRDIDLMDNGAMTPVPGHVATLMENWNPSFVETGRNEDAAFLQAAEVASAVLVRACAHAAAAALAMDTVGAAAAAAEDPRIIVLDRKVPWEEAVFALGLDQAVYMVRPGKGDWTVNAVPPELGSFAQRLPLPEAWGGLRDESLIAASGVADATFCHPARFICGARSREGAVALARRALGVSAIGVPA